MKNTFKYSLASCLCSSNICWDSSLFGSGGAGRKCGSSIKCTESKSSSSAPPLAPDCFWSPLASNLGGFCEFLKVEFDVLTTLPSKVRELPEVEAIALDLESVVDSLSLVWLLAAIKKSKHLIHFVQILYMWS